MICRQATTAARLCLILSLGILKTAGLWAQSSNGSVHGAVQDATDAVIPSTAVQLTNVATGAELTTTSNETGFSIFPSVITGSYRLKVVAPGMQAFEAAVHVQTAQSTTVGVTLRPSGTRTIVQVYDIVPILVTDNPTLGATLERVRIEELPINGRNHVGGWSTTQIGRNSTTAGIMQNVCYAVARIRTMRESDPELDGPLSVLMSELRDKVQAQRTHIVRAGTASRSASLFLQKAVLDCDRRPCCESGHAGATAANGIWAF